MPNILQRPMFRRGGSAAKGTGITSGLTERKNYQEGDLVGPGRILGPIEPSGTITPDVSPVSRQGTITDISEELIKKPLETTRVMPRPEKESAPMQSPSSRELESQMGIIRGLSERMKPTGGDVIDDTMAAIASTAPDDPTKLQTFGQFLAKAGAGATGLRRQREEGIKKFEREATLEALKNLNKDEKDQLFRYAKEYAKRTGISEDKAYKMFLDRYLQGTPAKGLTTERLTQDNINRVLGSRKGRNLDMGEVNTVASTLTAMQKGETGGISGGIISRNAFTGEEGAASAGAEVGRNYINPTDGFIYRYDGKGKFTKVWPSK